MVLSAVTDKSHLVDFSAHGGSAGWTVRMARREEQGCENRADQPRYPHPRPLSTDLSPWLNSHSFGMSSGSVQRILSKVPRRVTESRTLA